MSIKKKKRAGLFQLLILIAVLLITANVAGCTSTEYSQVYEVYYQAIVYPENFDSYVESNQSKFDEDFYSCLEERRSFFFDAAADHYTFCSQFADPDIRQQCEQENEPAKVLNVLDAINEVARTGISFEETLIGSVLILSKETLGSYEWEELQKSVVPNYRPFLVCE